MRKRLDAGSEALVFAVDLIAVLMIRFSCRAIKMNLANEGLEARKKEEEVATRKRKAEDDKTWEGAFCDFFGHYHFHESLSITCL